MIHHRYAPNRQLFSGLHGLDRLQLHIPVGSEVNADVGGCALRRGGFGEGFKQVLVWPDLCIPPGWL